MPAKKKKCIKISYGSLKETKYLLHFSLIEKYLPETKYRELILLSEEIGKMLWSTIQKI